VQVADQLLAGLLEGAPDAMICVDRCGRIALVNAQTERLFGYQRDELADQPVEILVPELAHNVADPKSRTMELSARHRDGSTFPTETSLSAIETDDGLLVIAAVRDVTERLESLGQLAGGVAHDLNNLLAVISNYAAFVGEEVAKDGSQIDRQSVREDVRQIQLAAGRATELTDQLLASARIAAGRGIQAGPTPGQEPGGGRGETVLIVEDKPAMREVIRRILSRSGYQVIAATSGHEAIEIAASHVGDIDVLLTDVVMPRMLGKEAAERIRALRPGVKVLFMSGYAQGVLDSQGVVEVGVNLIQKPFSEAELLATLGQVIASATPHQAR
jgi:PAS domain S-box-containing protein